MNPENLQLALTIVPPELWNTLYMVFVSALFATLLGTPLGIILAITSRGHLKENLPLHSILGTIVNIGRSFPFAILMIAIIPFTRLIVGTSLGTTASIVPLTIAAIPFFARVIEAALREVDKLIIEAALVMGSSTWQIIYKVLFPEALPTILLGMTTMIIHLIGYSAMAGTMGGGGLGKVAIQYGYQRFNVFLIVVTVVILIIIVQIVQWVGMKLVHHINRQRGRVYSK